MTPLLQLAERIEAAEGLDRELDCLVANAVEVLDVPKDGRVTWYPGDYSLPRFTASIDAALTLVPEGCEWSVGWAGNSDAHVNVLPDGPQFDGYAATPALALCAASLRARASEAERIDDGR